MIIQKIILFLLLIDSVLNLQAQVRLSNLFTDNMVLQRDQPLKIWGWADKGESVTIEFCGEKAKTRASKDGKWAVAVGSFPFGGPFELKVKGKNSSIVLKNVLIGDVWICSGQSNMCMSVNGSLNAQYEIAAANYPKIRLFTVSADINNQKQEDVPGGRWVVCSPETVGSFSATGGLMREVIEAQKYANVVKSEWFDVEITKLWLEKLCVEAGVELLYHTRVVDVVIEKRKLKAVITENSNGRRAWPADVFIDTTGNGDLAARARCGFDFGHPESGLTQPSLNILVSGIQLKDLQDRKMIAMPGLSWAEPKENLLAEIRRGGADCSYNRPTFFAIREDFFSLMSNGNNPTLKSFE